MGEKFYSYLLKGPQAIERRLVELDDEFLHLRSRLRKLVALKSGLSRFKLGSLVEGSEKMLRLTLQEIQAERRALHRAVRSLVGSSLRSWELKESDPAPSI